MPLAAQKPPRLAVLRPKQAVFSMDECCINPAFSAVDSGGGDAVSQRLNRRKGTNNNCNVDGLIFTTWTAARAAANP